MKIAKGLTIIFGLSVVTAFAVNFVSPRGIALFGNWDISKGVITAKEKGYEGGRFVELTKIRAAKEIFDRGESLFVDARHPDAYHDGHIPGAASLPADQAASLIHMFIGMYDPSTPLVIYCSGRECEDSHNLARFLSEVGYADIKIFIDGYPGWKAEGYPNE